MTAFTIIVFTSCLCCAFACVLSAIGLDEGMYKSPTEQEMDRKHAIKRYKEAIVFVALGIMSLFVLTGPTS